MINQETYIGSTALQAEALSDLSMDYRTSLLAVVSLITLFIPAISVSPLVEVINSISIVSVLGLIILPILISGIINLILIIR